ncbi:cysteine rich repeat-containing protein [Rhizobium sp. C4]|uniref:cysteine rich repeat-containing protein n=1 Tax=Rhizobium sp. C4 TaxID=1349800 RepID=UPI001E2FEE1F|nr:cysteine rich repeat-containing protein [Rhizobium sp. C4]MCD2174146.1 cysteine rich repeat-containing protein [Rhizobium sp. C4]
MKTVTLTIAWLASAFAAGAANAKEPGYFELMKVKSACSADIAKFCNEVQPGKGRIMMCLKAHQTEVSKTCINAAAPYAADADKLTNN